MRLAAGCDAGWRAALGVDGAMDPSALLHDPRGWTVRWAPWRRTLRVDDAGRTWFVKLRWGRRGDARREWRRLHELAVLGIGVPTPLALAWRGRASALAMAAVPGVPLDRLVQEALAGGRDVAALPLAAVRAVGALAGRLHAAGCWHRDLYLNHLFAAGLDEVSSLHLIDVERVRRGPDRGDRWRIKDLGGLWASWTMAVRAGRGEPVWGGAPEPLPAAVQQAFCAAYAAAGGAPAAGDAAQARLTSRAARILGHRPRRG